MTEVQATAGTDITPLLRPLRIGQLELKNRFVMPGMQRAWCVDGAPDERLREYYRRRALGGTALVVCEACAVDHPSAASNPMFARLDARTTDAWRACVEAVHAADGRIFIQLWHQGAVDTGKAGPDFTALSPSGLEKAGKSFGRPASAAELAEIIDAFARCAVIARDIGADGVEVHACHGYLLDQFLWAETNQRADQYGGPGIADRAAFPAAVVAAVRAAVGPGYPVAIRISQWKEADYEAKVAASPAELAELVAILRAAGTDLFHVSTRRFWTPEWPGSDLGLAGWVKSFTDAPVIAVGSVGLDIDVMATLTGEEAMPTGPGRIGDLVRRFERGDFDLISIGRSLIGDPDWVAKMRDGRGAEIRPFRRTDLQWLSLSGPCGGCASSLRGVHRFRFVLISELTKIRSVRSMSLALLLTPAVCAGLGYAVSLSLRLSFPRLPAQQRHDWDPLFATFYGLSIGQLALVVFGVNVTGSEYPTRAIMTSLAAVPRRGRFYAAKVAAGLLAAAGSAVLAVAATFLAAQAALGPLGVRAGAPGTLRAALGACLYLTLISALAMGVAAITRSPALSLVVLTPLLFLDSQGLGNVPGLQRVIDYLPDQAGAVIAHLSGAGAGQFGRPYGPWTGIGIMAAWAAAALIGGYLVLARTDAAGEPGPRGLRWLLAKDRTPPLQNGCG